MRAITILVTLGTLQKQIFSIYAQSPHSNCTSKSHIEPNRNDFQNLAYVFTIFKSDIRTCIMLYVVGS